MKKVVFLKVGRGGGVEDSTALVLQRSADGYLTIQGYQPVPWAERHECWQLFRRAAKRLLGVCEASAVSVSLSEPPHTSVADLGDVFRQPSHIVSLTLSALPGEPEEREKSEAVRSCCGWPQEPTAVPSGLYQPPRPSPFSSPQARRRTTPGTTQGGCQGKKEMERLLAGLDEVSQTLERTQSRCEAIARRCEAVQREREEPDCRLEEEEEDSRVERLLRVAESLTARLISHQQQRRSPTPTATASGVSSPRQPVVMMSSERGGEAVPECPVDVTAQPSVNGGLIVFWRPVRLDGRDRNNGCKVAGYAVYVDGAQLSKVDKPFGSHAEIEGLERGREYQIQVSTLSADERESPLSSAIQYRHEPHSSTVLPVTSLPDNQKASQSAKVEKWLLTNSHTPCHLSPHHTLRDTTPERNSTEAPPTSHTHTSEDAWSMGSSHTSGIVMDHPPGSPKPSCPSYCHGDGFSVHSGATTMIVDGANTLSPYHPHHQLHFTPSPTPSSSATSIRARSLTPQQSSDRLIDEPLDLGAISADEAETRAAATVRLVVGSRHRGPAPPSNVQVTQRQPGWLHVSWTPTRRDVKGCSNGYFILGYRVYINGQSRASVDGPMTHEASVRWPHPPDSTHKLRVEVRARSISAESLSSATVLFDTILQESVEKYSGLKVNSPLSSTTTLCPSNSPRPLHAIVKPAARSQGAVTQETYV